MRKLQITGKQQQARNNGQRRRRRRRARGGQQIGLAQVATTQPRMRVRSGRQVEGEVTLSRKEMLADVILKSGQKEATLTKYLYPDTSGGQMKWLSGLAKSFDRFKFHKIHIFYKPAVSAMVTGRVSIGIDWNQSISTPTAESATACTPAMQCPVWEDTEGRPLILPRSRLQNVTWYRVGNGTGTDRGPGNVVLYLSSATATADVLMGSLWIDYTITFSGTNTT